MRCTLFNCLLVVVFFPSFVSPQPSPLLFPSLPSPFIHFTTISISIGIMLMLANVSCCRPGHKTKRRYALRFFFLLLSRPPSSRLAFVQRCQRAPSEQEEINCGGLFVISHLSTPKSSRSILCNLHWLQVQRKRKKNSRRKNETNYNALMVYV